MRSLQSAANPFALMMNPEAVFAAIERSGRLAHLSSRICRPLDKPQAVPPENGAAAEEDDADLTLEAGSVPDDLCE